MEKSFCINNSLDTCSFVLTEALDSASTLTECPVQISNNQAMSIYAIGSCTQQALDSVLSK